MRREKDQQIHKTHVNYEEHIMSKKTAEENEKRKMIATTTKKSGPASSAEQAKAQLIEVIQVRLADFIEEQMCALEKEEEEEEEEGEGDAYDASDDDGFFYKAVKRMGWTDNKMGLDAMNLSVNFSVYMENQGEGDVAYVTMHITPSIRVEECDFVTGRPTGVSNQEFRSCESTSLDLSVA